MPITVNDDGSVTSDGRSLTATIEASLDGIRAKARANEAEFATLQRRGLDDPGRRERAERIAVNQERLAEQERGLIDQLRQQEQSIAAARQHFGREKARGDIEWARQAGVLRSEGGADLGVEPDEGARRRSVRHNVQGSDPWARRNELATTPLHVDGSDVRARAMSAVEQTEVPDEAKRDLADLLDRSDDFAATLDAQFLLAHSDPAYRSAFRKVLVGRGQGHLEFTAQEQAAFRHVRSIQRALTIGGSGSADLLVPMELDPSVMLVSAGSVDPVRQLATVRRTRTDTLHLVASAGVTAHWRAEAEEMTDDSPVFTQPTVEAHRADVFIPYSWESAQDAVNLEDQLRTLMRDAKQEHEAVAWITGTGVGQPQGLVAALTGTASEIDTAGPGAFAVGDVYTALEAVPPRFRPATQVLAPLPIINAMRRFETADEPAVLSDSGDSVLGRPLHEVSHMDVGTVGANDKVLIAGDVRRGYVIADRIGASIRVIDVLFGPVANYPTGESGLVMFWRTGGAVVLPEALVLLNVQ